MRRKSRYALTGFGVALGVSVLFGVQVASGATSRALDRTVAASAGDADVIVRPAGGFDAVLPDGTEQRLSTLPDVERVVSTLLFRSFALTGTPKQEEDLSGFNPDAVFVHGVDLDSYGRVHDFDLAEGRLFRAGTDELLVSRAFADAEDIRLGQQVRLATAGGFSPFTVAGILENRGAGAVEGGDAVYTDIATARRVHGRGDVITRSDVVLGPGVSRPAWIAAHQPALSNAVTMQDADDLSADFRSFVSAVNGALSLISAIALFVGGFLIFLTFSLAVAERTRIFGTMRAIGAVPRQVRRVVVVEAALLGLVASALGLLIGYGFAAAMVGLLEALLDLPLPSLGLPVGAAIVSVVLAVLVSVAAAWIPGRRAAALSPVVAMRQGVAAAEPAGRPWVGVVLTVVGVLLGLFGPSGPARNLAALTVLLGSVLLVPFVLRPISRVLGAVTRRLARGVGEIAVMHLVKERSRSAYTLALVMVVLAMVLSVGASNQAMSKGLDKVLERQYGGNIQVFAAGAFEPGVGEELARVPGVETTSPIQLGETDLLDGETSRRTFMAIIDPATYFEVASFAWSDGDDAAAREALGRGGAILLPDIEAERLGVARGGEVSVRMSDGVQQLRLAGTYEIIGFGFGAVFGSPDIQRLGAGRPNGYLVGLTDGADPEQARAEILRTLGSKYQLFVDTPESVKAQAHEQLQGFFGLAYAMLGLAALTGLLGLANTLVVSVLTRTREIGMLRSTGAIRRQVRGMVLVEAATLALVAFVLALPLAWVLSASAISGQRQALGLSIDFLYPWGLLIPLGIAALFVAGLASLVPARRAGRLEPVAALRFD